MHLKLFCLTTAHLTIQCSFSFPSYILYIRCERQFVFLFSYEFFTVEKVTSHKTIDPVCLSILFSLYLRNTYVFSYSCIWCIQRIVCMPYIVYAQVKISNKKKLDEKKKRGNSQKNISFQYLVHRVYGID